MEVKFGVFVPQGWKLDLPRSKSPVEQFETMKKVALESERLGFDSIWFFDHLHTVPAPINEPVFECWTSLAAMAEVTTKIRLGQLVTCNLFRFPSILAKMASTLDIISRGRLNLGLGAGWNKDETVAYGIDFPSTKERIERLEETLQIIKAMWLETKASFKGKYYQIKEAINSPKPIQKPHPPIWIGGGGERRTLKIVAKYADVWNYFCSPEVYQHKLEVLLRHCQDANRRFEDIEKSLTTTMVITRSKIDGAFKIYRNYAKAFLKRPIRTLSFIWNYYTDSTTKPYDIIGSPEEIIKTITEFTEMGVTQFVFYFPDAAKLESLQVFRDKVMPSF